MNVCDICPNGFELWNPVADLPDTYVGLYDDNRFPGRCLVVLKEHHEHFNELSADCVNKFMTQIQQVMDVVKLVTGVERVNLAILGNTVPHIHAHLIPRYPDEEKYPGKSPWNDPRTLVTLPTAERIELIEKFNRHLTGLS